MSVHLPWRLHRQLQLVLEASEELQKFLRKHLTVCMPEETFLTNADNHPKPRHIKSDKGCCLNAEPRADACALGSTVVLFCSGTQREDSEQGISYSGIST